VGEEDAGGGDGGKGKGAEELGEGGVEGGSVGTEFEVDVAREAVGEVVTFLHDGDVEDLGLVVIGEEEMDLAGEGGGPFEGVEEEVEGGIVAFGAEGSAVDEFLEDDVAAGVVAKIGGGLEALEIAGVVVEVAGHEEGAFAGEAEHLGVAEGVGRGGVRGGAEEGDGFVGGHGREMTNGEMPNDK
jgi:hypothetical protein